MSRTLVVLGIALLLAGLFWPVLARLGLGRLPGDFRFQRAGFVFYFPLTSGFIVSLVVSILAGFLRR